jgi:hypothetical protein
MRRSEKNRQTSRLGIVTLPKVAVYNLFKYEVE